MGGPQILAQALDTIADCIHYKTHFTGSTAELNYLDAFEDGFLDLWQSVSQMVLTARTDPAIHSYFNSNSTLNLL